MAFLERPKPSKTLPKQEIDDQINRLYERPMKKHVARQRLLEAEIEAAVDRMLGANGTLKVELPEDPDNSISVPRNFVMKQHQLVGDNRLSREQQEEQLHRMYTQAIARRTRELEKAIKKKQVQYDSQLPAVKKLTGSQQMDITKRLTDTYVRQHMSKLNALHKRVYGDPISPKRLTPQQMQEFRENVEQQQMQRDKLKEKLEDRYAWKRVPATMARTVDPDERRAATSYKQPQQHMYNKPSTPAPTLGGSGLGTNNTPKARHMHVPRPPSQPDSVASSGSGLCIDMGSAVGTNYCEGFTGSRGMSAGGSSSSSGSGGGTVEERPLVRGSIRHRTRQSITQDSTETENLPNSSISISKVNGSPKSEYLTKTPSPSPPPPLPHPPPPREVLGGRRRSSAIIEEDSDDGDIQSVVSHTSTVSQRSSRTKQTIVVEADPDNTSTTPDKVREPPTQTSTEPIEHNIHEAATVQRAPVGMSSSSPENNINELSIKENKHNLQNPKQGRKEKVLIKLVEEDDDEYSDSSDTEDAARVNPVDTNVQKVHPYAGHDDDGMKKVGSLPKRPSVVLDAGKSTQKHKKLVLRYDGDDDSDDAEEAG